MCSSDLLTYCSRDDVDVDASCVRGCGYFCGGGFYGWLARAPPPPRAWLTNQSVHLACLRQRLRLLRLRPLAGIYAAWSLLRLTKRTLGPAEAHRIRGAKWAVSASSWRPDSRRWRFRCHCLRRHRHRWSRVTLEEMGSADFGGGGRRGGNETKNGCGGGADAEVDLLPNSVVLVCCYCCGCDGHGRVRVWSSNPHHCHCHSAARVVG